MTHYECTMCHEQFDKPHEHCSSCQVGTVRASSGRHSFGEADPDAGMPASLRAVGGRRGPTLGLAEVDHEAQERQAEELAKEEDLRDMVAADVMGKRASRVSGMDLTPRLAYVLAGLAFTAADAFIEVRRERRIKNEKTHGEGSGTDRPPTGTRTKPKG